MSENQAGDEKIETQYMLLYVYKIIRLIIIAIIITYFVGCFWWLFCSNYTSSDGENTFINYFNLNDLDEFY
jgi:hypothetical protein